MGGKMELKKVCDTCLHQLSKIKFGSFQDLDFSNEDIL